MAHEDISSLSSALSSDNGEIYSLSERINISTRSTHAQLNRLIITRLPLALPPYTSNPSAYLSGILHIAPIYITFESLWQRILDAQCCSQSPLMIQAELCSRKNFILTHLQLPGLLRSERLRADIRTLSGNSEQEVEEQLYDISQNGEISRFIAHITKSVTAKPHVLLAYAWVMYMALFSGGRFLRASLRNAGEEFWLRSPSHDHSSPLPQKNSDCVSDQPLDGKESSNLPNPLENKPTSANRGPRVNQGLQFFHFLGEEDGEDIKRKFKKRFSEAETLLSRAEQDDIVQEAQHIFNFMIDMVGELDRVCGSMDLGIGHAEKYTSAAMRGGDSISSSNKGMSKSQDVLDQSFRKLTLLGRRYFGAGSVISKRHDSATIDVQKVPNNALDICFVTSVLFLALASGVCYFTYV